MKKAVVLTRMGPSLLALMSADEMNKNFLPALQHITKHLRLPSQTSDILYLKISAFLQGYYLYFNDSSLAEHYWGLTRSYLAPSSTVSMTSSWLPTPSLGSEKLKRIFRILGFLQTILTPFLNQKLQSIHNDLYHKKDLSKFQKISAQIYPYLNLGITALNILLKISYFLNITEKHCISNYILGIKYHSNRSPGSTNTFRQVIELVFPVAIFYVQFIKQWSSIEVSPYEASIKPPPRHIKTTPDVCPLCGSGFSIPTAVPTTGLVYCYVCIFTFIQREGRCPVSHLPANTKDLVKLNLS